MDEPKPRTGYLRKFARELLKRHGITEPPVDLRRLVECEGLEYQEVDYFPDDVDALIIPIDGRIVAAVNMNQTRTRRRFSLAHELGHHLLHPDRSIHEERMTVDSEISSGCSRKKKDIYETEADMFAGELLVPLPFLKKTYKSGMSIPEVANIFDVSESVSSIAISTHYTSLF